MANLGKKNDIFVIRFRYQGVEYKKSLKTRSLLQLQRAGLQELLVAVSVVREATVLGLGNCHWSCPPTKNTLI